MSSSWPPEERRTLREAATLALARLERDVRRRHAPGRTQRLWDELVRGRWALVDQFARDGRRHLVARRCSGARGRFALTPAETLCLAAVIDGRAQKLVAAELGIAESTVSTHVRRAMRKLELATRAELARAFGVRPQARERSAPPSNDPLRRS